MPADLQPPLPAYFDASNRHDPDALARLFADGASVRDEGREMIGGEAIRDWAKATFRKYRTALTPLAAEQQDGAIQVSVQVAGTFPGSPVTLRFRFEIAAGKIAALEIA